MNEMHNTFPRDGLVDPLTPTVERGFGPTLSTIAGFTSKSLTLNGGHQTRIKGTEALTAPELLSAILDHATQHTLASAVCVSRAWSYIAPDKLWLGHNIKVIDLLKILPPESEEAFDPPHSLLGKSSLSHTGWDTISKNTKSLLNADTKTKSHRQRMDSFLLLCLAGSFVVRIGPGA